MAMGGWASPEQFHAAVLALLREGPAALEQVMARLHAADGYGLSLNEFWNAHRRSVPARLNRLVAREAICKVLVRGRNVFAPAEGVLAEAAARFDLADPAARLVAADWVEEQGDPELAGLLRKARRWAFGPGA
jgi:uncharacterized protein (TIGR02996 family)